MIAAGGDVGNGKAFREPGPIASEQGSRSPGGFEMAVSNPVDWATSLDEAKVRSRQENKPILLDFFKPT